MSKSVFIRLRTYWLGTRSDLYIKMPISSVVFSFLKYKSCCQSFG